MKVKRSYNKPDAEFKGYLGRMEESNAKDYILAHVLDQIDWFDRKSIVKQRIYKTTMIISIIMSSLIPVITLIADIPGNLEYKIAITALGSCITALSAVNSFCKFRELWIQYRVQCETLKSILHMFFASCGDGTPYAELVASCEEYMKKETESWADSMPCRGSYSSTGS